MINIIYLNKIAQFKLLSLVFLLACLTNEIKAQNKIKVNAIVNTLNNEINIDQTISYTNTSKTTLNEIYLNDWISSYSRSDTKLVQKLLNEFNTDLYVANKKNRGYTNIESVFDKYNNKLSFVRESSNYDLIKIILKNPLKPNDAINISLQYSLIIQSDDFTSYGKTKENDYILNSWYLTPAVYDGEWKLYSNLNFDSPYTTKSNINLSIDVPKSHQVHSELNMLKKTTSENRVQYHYTGEKIKNHKVYITKEKFRNFESNSINIITNIINKNIDSLKEIEIFNKVNAFVKQNVPKAPKNKIIISRVDLKKNNLYGLALLPDFLSPFPKDFKYELVIAKNIIKNQLDQIFDTDPRKEYWLKNGFQMLLLIRYLDTYYPNQKLMGKLADFWGIRNYNFSKLNYSEQYRLTYYQMIRTGRDQALTTPKSKLLSFNERFTSYYKSAIGLMYLKNYIGDQDEISWIKDFLIKQKGEITSIENFKSFLADKTNKNLDWFFENFISESFSSDYKIKSIYLKNDSIKIRIKNLNNGAYPVTITSIKDGKSITSKWLEGFSNFKTITTPNTKADKFVLNYKHESPEFNRKNNWKSVGNTILNKPLQIRIFRDIQDPDFNQLNIMPVVEFQNVYDGFKIGLNINNRSLLAKPLVYALVPTFGTRSNNLAGNAKVIYNRFYENKKLYNSMIGFTFDRSSFDYGAFITKIQPFAQFSFRSNDDLRSNSVDHLQFRYINIQKDNSRSILDENDIPPYKIFNLRYISLDNDIANFKNWSADIQLSKRFGKINFNYEIRKRTPKNQQYKFRLFAGAFIYNRLPTNETSFNYALDRPINYLFDYNYLGQSESSGFLSQQLVIAEGGFKSKLEPAFANQWITSVNTSASIWRYVQAYVDLGYVKNRGNQPFFAYDSGVRLDLIIDYFELYFPVYSNLGWEINQSNYSEKIRFVLTTDISKLASLFTRKWF